MCQALGTQDVNALDCLGLHNSELGLILLTGIYGALIRCHFPELHGYDEEDANESGTSLAIILKNLIHEVISKNT